MATLDLRSTGGTLRLAANGGSSTVRSYMVVGPQGPPGPPGSGTGSTTTPSVGVDTDGVPYFDQAGVTGGTSVQADTDGVPYFV